MGRGCFEKIAVLFFCLLEFSLSSQAHCLLADKYRQEGKTTQMVIALSICAVQYNDDESQMKMAENYATGQNGVEKNEKDALYMYQLAAENGNAEAQVKLAELLQSFDTTAERRQALKNYQAQLKKISEKEGSFAGEILHPYTLLLLASERAENKWYYPSLNRAAPARAAGLLSRYKISSEMRQVAMQDASRWKTRKLLEAAQEVLSPSEYPSFEKRLKNNATRTQAMADLKEHLMGYVDKRQQERSKTL